MTGTNRQPETVTVSPNNQWARNMRTNFTSFTMQTAAAGAYNMVVSYGNQINTVTVTNAFRLNDVFTTPTMIRNGGARVTIAGARLGSGSDITSVSLAGVQATIVAQTNISVTVDAAPYTSTASGFGNIVVLSTTVGTTTALNGATYYRAAAFTVTCTPNQFPLNSGATVTITVSDDFFFGWESDIGPVDILSIFLDDLEVDDFDVIDHSTVEITLPNEGGGGGFGGFFSARNRMRTFSEGIVKITSSTFGVLESAPGVYSEVVLDDFKDAFVPHTLALPVFGGTVLTITASSGALLDQVTITDVRISANGPAGNLEFSRSGNNLLVNTLPIDLFWSDSALSGNVSIALSYSGIELAKMSFPMESVLAQPSLVGATVVPSSGRGNGGNTVTITAGAGKIFGGDVLTVTIGGVAATIQSQTATTLTIHPGAKAAGTAQMLIIKSASRGTAWLDAAYTYNAAVSCSIQPATFPNIGATTVTVSLTAVLGSGATDIVNVTLAGVAATILSQTATSVTVRAGKFTDLVGGQGRVVLTSTSAGTYTSDDTEIVTYERAAVLTATPSTIESTGGAVVITGDKAIGTGADIVGVTLAGVTATIVSQTTTSVTVSAAEGPADGITGDIVIVSGDSVFTIEDGITYEPAAPDVEVPDEFLLGELDVDYGSVEGGYNVTVVDRTSTRTRGVKCSVDDILVPAVVDLDEDEVICYMPAHAAGNVTLFVVKDGGEPKNFTFRYFAVPKADPIQLAGNALQIVAGGTANLTSFNIVTANASTPVIVRMRVRQGSFRVSGFGSIPVIRLRRVLAVSMYLEETASSTTLVMTGTATEVNVATAATVYTPSSTAFGSDQIEVTIQDTSLPAGVVTSLSLSVPIMSINQRPTMSAPSATNVIAVVGQRVLVNGFVTPNAGSVHETSQQFTFAVTAARTPFFSYGPVIYPNGTLEFVAAEQGSTTISAVVQDNGGTANGGQDTSASLSVTVTAHYDLTTAYIASGAVIGSVVLIGALVLIGFAVMKNGAAAAATVGVTATKTALVEDIPMEKLVSRDDIRFSVVSADDAPLMDNVSYQEPSSPTVVVQAEPVVPSETAVAEVQTAVAVSDPVHTAVAESELPPAETIENVVEDLDATANESTALIDISGTPAK
eukprot:TRINITY_DN4392_c0_g1_i4.p1 TRINITY_DN4392_c0_g1~~TRINITY_DN4392_c0_g1_i4.p1  ORF type:complete len:1186 (-),score=331.85 TRINITY_DN4392_c0_g1_i4:47-3451(-)